MGKSGLYTLLKEGKSVCRLDHTLISFVDFFRFPDIFHENGVFDTVALQAEPIQLGLDINLQAYGEKLMQNKKGCIVAIEPSSGEILSMVSLPLMGLTCLGGTEASIRTTLACEAVVVVEVAVKGVVAADVS